MIPHSNTRVGGNQNDRLTMSLVNANRTDDVLFPPLNTRLANISVAS